MYDTVDVDKIALSLSLSLSLSRDKDAANTASYTFNTSEAMSTACNGIAFQ